MTFIKFHKQHSDIRFGGIKEDTRCEVPSQSILFFVSISRSFQEALTKTRMHSNRCVPTAATRCQYRVPRRCLQGRTLPHPTP